MSDIMTRGERTAATPIVDDSLEALALHEHEMNEFLESSDELGGGTEDDLFEDDFDEYMDAIGKFIMGDVRAWVAMNQEVYGSSPRSASETSEEQTVNPVQKGLTRAATGALTFLSETTTDAYDYVGRSITKTNPFRDDFLENKLKQQERTGLKSTVTDEQRAGKPAKSTKRADAQDDKNGGKVIDIKTAAAKRAKQDKIKPKTGRNQAQKKNEKKSDRRFKLEITKDMGMRAVATILMGAGIAGLGSQFAEIKNIKKSDGTFITTASAVGYETAIVERNVHSYAIGGNTQMWPNIEEFDVKGYMPGDNDDGIHYPASMGLAPGDVPAAESTRVGSDQIVARWREAEANGDMAHFVAYSFGAYPAWDAAWRIYHENGNQWPDNVTFDIAGPGGVESIGKGSFGKLAEGFIGLDPGLEERGFPPGAKIRIIYRADDPYASGGNESLGSLMYQLAGIPFGTHEAPALGDPNYTWTSFRDANGIEHLVAHPKNSWVVTALQKAGINLVDTESANKAIYSLFPQNHNPNTPPPDANVQEAMTHGARALDRQVEHELGLAPGSFTMFENVVARMPEPWKVLMNDSWNGFNHISQVLADAAANPTPENVMNAFTTVMQEVGKITNGVQQVLGDPVGDVREWTVSTTTDQVKQYSRQYLGHEIDVRPYLEAIADKLLTIQHTTPQVAPNVDASIVESPEPTDSRAGLVPRVPVTFDEMMNGKRDEPQILNGIPENTSITVDVSPATQPQVSLPNMPLVDDTPPWVNAPPVIIQQNEPAPAPAPTPPAVEAPAPPVVAPAPAPAPPPPPPRPAPQIDISGILDKLNIFGGRSSGPSSPSVDIPAPSAPAVSAPSGPQVSF